MKRTLSTICASIALLAFTNVGIAQDTSSDASIATQNKQTYCQFQDFQNHVFCADGDIILFQPTQWGNDQLPLLAIYFLCNPEKPVQFNRAAVVCTYQKKAESQFKDADQLAQLMAQQKLQQGQALQGPGQDLPAQQP